MRWARRHLDLAWPAGGPRWQLIVNSTAGKLVGACQRDVLPPFELVPEMPADMRCHRCDTHVAAAAAQMTEPPRGTPDRQRDFLALRAIVVSGRTALRKTPSPDRGGIGHRVTELLGRLEEAAVRDGADPEFLARLDEAQREVWQ